MPTRRWLRAASVAVGLAAATVGIAVLAAGSSKPRHAHGTLRVRVRDSAGARVPARLTFRGVSPTPTPRFTTTDIGREEGSAIVVYDRAFLAGADSELVIPAGTYDVWATRGPEWSADRRRVTVPRGGATTATFTLASEVPTPGWSSGDFHVHAQASYDSKVPMRDRVVQFVSDGVDLIVSTDHNTIADYGPIIQELGVGALLTSLTGDEITTSDWGHFGAFPLPLDPAEAGGGAIGVRGRVPAAIFADVRTSAPRALIDVHHPRLEGGAMGYFHLARFDPRTFAAARAGFSFDFDAIEVLNGYQDADRVTLDAVLGDWFAFLDRGRLVTATGNSDSHHLRLNLGGYPRNYCVTPHDAPSSELAADMVAAVRRGACFFTSGPILDVRVGDVGLGGTAPAVAGGVDVRIVVRAASWIGVDALSVYVGGRIAHVESIVGTGPTRFDKVVHVDTPRDTYVVVRAEGQQPMAPMIGDDPTFRVTPIAITNPIWIDADGDGQVSPALAR